MTYLTDDEFLNYHINQLDGTDPVLADALRRMEIMRDRLARAGATAAINVALRSENARLTSEIAALELKVKMARMQ